MKTKESILKSLIAADRWISTNDLVNEFNISVRTLRSAIKEINDQFDSLIESSRSGYRIDPAKLAAAAKIDTFFCSKDQAVESSEDRQEYIIKKFLLSNNELDYYDLIEGLFVSESTLNADLTALRQRLEPYDIVLSRQKDCLCINGCEKDIRKLMSDNIYNEIEDGLLNFNIIKSVFPDYDVTAIRNELSATLMDYGLSADVFALTDLVLHLCIMLDRITFNQLTIINGATLSGSYPFYIEMTKALFAKLTELTGIAIPASEIAAIAPLLSIDTRQMLDQNITMNELSELVPKEIIKFVRKISRRVLSEFSLNLNDDFVIRFSLHLNQIIQNHHVANRNPLLKSIKNSYPLVFEVSVFISNMIHDRYPDIIMDDHDISFIALHVGMSINKDPLKKVNTLFILPNYWSLNKNIVKQIHMMLTGKITIAATIADEAGIADYPDIDLIISLLPLAHAYAVPTVQITPFLSDKDQYKLYGQINSILMLKQLRDNLSIADMISEQCYISYDTKPASKDVIIHDLCQRLLNANYVDPAFEEGVILRERLSSTAYSNIAVPHALALTGKKTGIGIAIFRKYFNWDDSKINIVLLLVVNPDDKKMFKKVFQNAVSMFTSDAWNNEIKNIECFTDFMNLINTLGAAQAR